MSQLHIDYNKGTTLVVIQGSELLAVDLGLPQGRV